MAVSVCFSFTLRKLFVSDQINDSYYTVLIRTHRFDCRWNRILNSSCTLSAAREKFNRTIFTKKRTVDFIARSLSTYYRVDYNTGTHNTPSTRVRYNYYFVFKFPRYPNVHFRRYECPDSILSVAEMDEARRRPKALRQRASSSSLSTSTSFPPVQSPL